MIKKLFILTLTLTGLAPLLAQKKEIDKQAIDAWPSLGSYGISPNGKYAWYVVDSVHAGRTLYITDASGKTKLSFKNSASPIFTFDSKNILLPTEQGISTIRLPDLKKSLIRDAGNVKVAANSHWITYTQNNVIRLVNISSGAEKILSGALDCWFDPSGKSLLIKYKDSLCLFKIAHQQSMKLFEGPAVESISFNEQGDQVLFSIVQDNDASIYKYSSFNNKTELMVSKQTPGFRKDIMLSANDFRFNKFNDIIFFRYKIIADTISKDSDMITDKVDVWSYKDRSLQSRQLELQAHKQRPYDPDCLYQGTMSLSGKNTFTFLETADTGISWTPGNKYTIVKRLNNGDEETHWNDEAWPSYQLVSLKDGVSTSFLPTNKDIYWVRLSSSEKFITWADLRQKKYFCYNIDTRQIIALPGKLIKGDDEMLAGGVYLSGWLADDAYAVWNDGYDIWLVDPTGAKEPISVTGGYGASKKIRFILVDEEDVLMKKRFNDEVILAAMEDVTNNNGYFKTKLSPSKQPAQLLWGPYLYYFMGRGMSLLNPHVRPPLKALNADVYLVQKQSDAESLNLFLTKDFVNNVFLSDIHPEKNFNWHHAKLIHWTTKAGDAAKGILYIPDNIDTTKSYPVIFNYYEIRNGELRKFKRPEQSPVNIDVPMYLSQGYLVFIPDIPRKRAHTFENALDVIESGALHLTNTYKWIDKTKMGLQGQSFGGTVTGFVATHSKLFAAAQSSSGRTDHFSSFGSTGFGGISLQSKTENGQNNLGYTPWERPDVYIKNSAIFGAADAVTPLLLAHGKGDGAVNFGQSIELFTALRRTGKKVWLLQYDEGHVIEGGDMGRDLFKRQQQFFDHFLKGAPAPLWMTEGVPAKYKGIRSGLTLDSINAVP